MELKVVTLEGCSWCNALIRELDKLGIEYENIDANENSTFADNIEDLLQTSYYPIIILSSQGETYYIFRPTSSKQLGKVAISAKLFKVGSATVESMIASIKSFNLK